MCSTTGESRDPIAAHVRALPDAPSLEYERKEAKALLKQIHAGNPDALQRVREVHPVSLRDRKPDELQLAEAQHVIAREYGFTSWPRLVEYFEEMERHRNAPRHNSSDDGMEAFDSYVQRIVRRHQRGDPFVARELAHFVPRFFDRPVAEILATPITDDEARLVVARQHRRVSWAELLERAAASRAQADELTWEGDKTPLMRARKAIQNADVDLLASILDEHPDLITPSVIDREWRRTLVSIAVTVECRTKTPEARRVSDFLASRGVDVQRELDERLLGMPQDRSSPENVRWYLERGANPNWMPPNGITVLEHALVRFQNAACVDLIAERVTPRRALWIAAGLGDVDGVRTFIARKGTLTVEGRLNRPDQMAMGWFVGLPSNRNADDLEIMWEAFEVAGWNERWAAMDVLLDAGLPVDHAPLTAPLVLYAVGSLQVPLAEYLVSRGADVDRMWPGSSSARELARNHFRYNPEDDDRKRLLALCSAGTPDEILAELDAKRPSPPPPGSRTLRAMQLAADDAARQGQSGVTTENILVGLLRVEGGVFAEFIRGIGTDMSTLRSMIGARLLPDEDPLLGQELPADAGAEAAVRTAASEADARRRSEVSPIHLMWGLLSQQSEPGAKLLAGLGMSEALWRERLKDL